MPMSFVKNTSYCEIPRPTEIPNEDYHRFLPLNKIAELSKNKDSVFRCRTIGVLSSKGQFYTLHDLNTNSAEIRVSLRYVKASLPYVGRPLTVQVFGSVEWHCEVGTIMYAVIVTVLSPPMAQNLLRLMEWIADHHRVTQPGDTQDETH